MLNQLINGKFALNIKVRGGVVYNLILLRGGAPLLFLLDLDGCCPILIFAFL